MSIFYLRRIGVFSICFLAVFSCVAQAQIFSVGENAVVNSGGCIVTQGEFENTPVLGSLDPKQWVTVQGIRDNRVHILLETEESSLDGWVQAQCLITTEAYFAAPVCSRQSWMERSFALDEEHPNAIARMVKVGSHYVLRIFDVQGQLLWSSPEETSEDPDAVLDQLTFFCGAEGDYWPEFLGDLNGDGKAELFMPAQHLSVESPLPLYMYTWDGKTFKDVSNARCLVEKSMGSGVYEWAEFFDEIPDKTRWLFSPLKGGQDGTSEWEVFEISGDSLLSGRALFQMAPDLGKATLIRWIKPLEGE